MAETPKPIAIPQFDAAVTKFYQALVESEDISYICSAYLALEVLKYYSDEPNGQDLTDQDPLVQVRKEVLQIFFFFLFFFY